MRPVPFEFWDDGPVTGEPYALDEWTATLLRRDEREAVWKLEGPNGERVVKQFELMNGVFLRHWHTALLSMRLDFLHGK